MNVNYLFILFPYTVDLQTKATLNLHWILCL